MGMICAFGKATRVGAEVRPEVVETEESDRGSLCEMSGLPEQEQRNCRSEFEQVPGRW